MACGKPMLHACDSASWLRNEKKKQQLQGDQQQQLQEKDDKLKKSARIVETDGKQDAAEHIQAFKMLDRKGRGYITLSQLAKYLEEGVASYLSKICNKLYHDFSRCLRWMI